VKLVHAALVRELDPPTRGGGSNMLVAGNAERIAAASLVGTGILDVTDSGDVGLSCEMTGRCQAILRA